MASILPGQGLTLLGVGWSGSQEVQTTPLMAYKFDEADPNAVGPQDIGSKGYHLAPCADEG